MLIILIGINIVKSNNTAKLIQLSPQTKSQMMGYIIKTKNDKMIVIDGGIGGDAANLMKYIEKHNNKVDYWFLTHNHNDHTNAFTEIINNEDVEVDNVYSSLKEK